MGCSNPHPHGQSWSLSAIPTLPAKELESMAEYARTTAVALDTPLGPQGNGHFR
jgi:UDPglucose--hexose-1-phosphate uridylyltransferase